MLFDLQRFATYEVSSFDQFHDFYVYDTIKAGDTIKLIANITVPDPEYYYQEDEFGGYEGCEESRIIFIGISNFTLDLNGYSITGKNDDHAELLDVRNSVLTIIDTSANKTGSIINEGSQPAIETWYASLIIEGGTFTEIENAQGTVTITGGTFSQNVTDWLGEGCEASDNGNGTYTVTQYVAEITDSQGNTTKYTDFTAAISALKNGDTIKMLKSVTGIESIISIEKQITPDLNGKTISGSNSN